MTEIRISIVVETEKEPTTLSIYEMLSSMKARLEGYSTDVPELLKKSKIHLDKSYLINGEEKDIFVEIKKEKENNLPKN